MSFCLLLWIMNLKHWWEWWSVEIDRRIIHRSACLRLVIQTFFEVTVVIKLVILMSIWAHCVQLFYCLLTHRCHTLLWLTSFMSAHLNSFSQYTLYMVFCQYLYIYCFSLMTSLSTHCSSKIKSCISREGISFQHVNIWIICSRILNIMKRSNLIQKRHMINFREQTLDFWMHCNNRSRLS
jgi:hypothetical protein